MALTNQPQVTLGLADNNAEVGTVSVRVEVTLDYDTAESAIVAAFMGIVNGSKKEQGTYDRDIDQNRVIGIKASDKSHTWKITARDAVTGRLFTTRVPTANGLLRLTDSDELDPALAAYTDLVAAVNTYVRHPTTGNAAIFVSCVYE